MPVLIAGVVAVVVLYSLLQMFRAADPVALARLVKIGGGLLLLGLAALTGIRGELVVAIPTAIAGATLLGWSPVSGSWFADLRERLDEFSARPRGPTSRVRSRFLDMTLYHNTGDLTGRVVAGPYARQSLGKMDLAQLTAMIPTFDAESVSLLESFLDRRFPAWREHAQGNAAGGQSRPPTGGKMTDEEAYQILGLQPGAGRDEISRAHRALMKKLHPDQGGSTYLAARVNEAKDTLLRTHHS